VSRAPAPPALELPGADGELNRVGDQIVGECANAVWFLLRGRRRSVKVSGLPETGRLQLVALLALAERTLELYPEAEREELRAQASRVAAVIGRAP